jgi:hypothetical protein
MSGRLKGLTVFHGEASTTLARVYARLPASDAAAGCELAGRVVGPRCRWAQTLPAASRLVARAAGNDADALLAEAVVPDPCFWSDELPMLYTVEVQLRRGGRTIAAAERPIGFRGVGRRGRSLFREGRRWVPRGMHAASVSGEAGDDLSAWRAAPAVMAVAQPSDTLCASASQVGVWIVAIADEPGDALVAELARLARYAAVFLVALPPGAAATAAMRRAARNVLLAERPAFHGTPHADCIFADAGDADAFAAAVRASELPAIACRRLATPQTLAAARRACDALQRDMAAVGDFAGYLV